MELRCFLWVYELFRCFTFLVWDDEGRDIYRLEINRLFEEFCYV